MTLNLGTPPPLSRRHQAKTLLYNGLQLVTFDLHSPPRAK
jgi:hypothetical protein